MLILNGTERLHRDLLWVGVLVGFVVGAFLGLLMGSEMGRGTRGRLEQAAQRVRSRLNGASASHEMPVEAEAQDSEES